MTHRGAAVDARAEEEPISILGVDMDCGSPRLVSEEGTLFLLLTAMTKSVS